MSTSDEQVVIGTVNMKRSWGWLLAMGILFIILGSIGLSMIVGITLASMFFLGVLLLIAGGIQIVDVFKSKHWRGVLSHGLVAVLYVAGGGLILYDPFLASSLITAALAGVLMVIGIARIWMSMMLRAEEGWGWFFIAGLAALVLGIMILLQWPFSGVWFIGLFISIELIICGWTYVFLSFGLRRKISRS
jgi:uncharacterized membrane protein HdeD (DUF308 family)